MKYSEAGKGSKPRKNQDNDSYGEGYDRIFGDKKKRQRDALDEMVRISEELGLYDDPKDEN